MRVVFSFLLLVIFQITAASANTDFRRRAGLIEAGDYFDSSDDVVLHWDDEDLEVAVGDLNSYDDEEETELADWNDDEVWEEDLEDTLGSPLLSLFAAHLEDEEDEAAVGLDSLGGNMDPTLDDLENDATKVAAVVGERRVGGRSQFLTRWEGYRIPEWYDEDKLIGYDNKRPEALLQWMKTHPEPREGETESEYDYDELEEMVGEIYNDIENDGFDKSRRRLLIRDMVEAAESVDMSEQEPTAAQDDSVYKKVENDLESLKDITAKGDLDETLAEKSGVDDGLGSIVKDLDSELKKLMLKDEDFAYRAEQVKEDLLEKRNKQKMEAAEKRAKKVERAEKKALEEDTKQKKKERKESKELKKVKKALKKMKAKEEQKEREEEDREKDQSEDDEEEQYDTKLSKLKRMNILSSRASEVKDLLRKLKMKDDESSKIMEAISKKNDWHERAMKKYETLKEKKRKLVKELKNLYSKKRDMESKMEQDEKEEERDEENDDDSNEAEPEGEETEKSEKPKKVTQEMEGKDDDERMNQLKKLDAEDPNFNQKIILGPEVLGGPIPDLVKAMHNYAIQHILNPVVHPHPEGHQEHLDKLREMYPGIDTFFGQTPDEGPMFEVRPNPAITREAKENVRRVEAAHEKLKKAAAIPPKKKKKKNEHKKKIKDLIRRSRFSSLPEPKTKACKSSCCPCGFERVMWSYDDGCYNVEGSCASCTKPAKDKIKAVGFSYRYNYRAKKTLPRFTFRKTGREWHSTPQYKSKCPKGKVLTGLGTIVTTYKDKLKHSLRIKCASGTDPRSGSSSQLKEPGT